MAKFGSFFRRLFTPNSSDDRNRSSSLTSESRKSVLIIPPSSSSSISSTSKLTTMTTQSCSTSPHMVIKPTTLNLDNTNKTSNSNYLSSDISKANIRRLSAPLIIHTSANYHSQYPSTIVNETTEEALLSSLQRSSLSSLQRSSLSSSITTTAHPHHSIHSLATGSGGGGGSSGSPLSRPDVRSASFNLSTSPSSLSNNLINNIPSTSGR